MPPQRGYEALVVTVDLPVLGIRERERRAQPPRSRGRHPAPGCRTDAGWRPAAALYGLIDPDLRWPDIEQFAPSSRLPVLRQGHPHRRGRRTGHRPRRCGRDRVQPRRPSARHGAVGRRRAARRSSMPSPARIDVLVDGGIRRGTDVLKALALGADAVLVGRPADLGSRPRGRRRRAAGASRSCSPSSTTRWRCRVPARRGPGPQLRHRRAVGGTPPVNILVTGISGLHRLDPRCRACSATATECAGSLATLSVSGSTYR